jgi:hypothetical protein
MLNKAYIGSLEMLRFETLPVENLAHVVQVFHKQ